MLQQTLNNITFGRMIRFSTTNRQDTRRFPCNFGPLSPSNAETKALNTPPIYSPIPRKRNTTIFKVLSQSQSQGTTKRQVQVLAWYSIRTSRLCTSSIPPSTTKPTDSDNPQQGKASSTQHSSASCHYKCHCTHYCYT